MKKVLIADDSQFIRNNFKKFFETTEYEVIGEAANGIEALKLNEELNPDLIILDITMPEMDGLEAIKEIRNQDKEVKIIICTTLGQNTIIEETQTYGAVGFVTKPFKAPILIKELEKAFSEEYSYSV